MDWRLPSIVISQDLDSADFDAIIVVAPDVDNITNDYLKSSLISYISAVGRTGAGKSEVFVVPVPDLPAKKLIFSATGTDDNEYDDVTKFSDAAKTGIKKALATGSKAPLMCFFRGDTKFREADIVTVLGAMQVLYVPLEMREQVPAKAIKASKVGIFEEKERCVEAFGPKLDLIRALESGRIVSRDIGGSDPERMAPPRVEEYIRKQFDGTDVKIEVVKGHENLKKEYPCFAAVDRCANQIERQQGRVIWLTYEPKGPVEKTVMIVGKGVTYDTGGADIKVGGNMAGMSRDKIGSANVAGFMKVVSMLKPSKVKVVAAMCMVRNSCGSNAYVSDEIITSRAGVRLRVINTDAEGRMAMVDVLAHMKEKALNEVNPHLMTIATLTGHAIRCVGPYCIVMDNGLAKKENFASKLQATGDLYGDMFEISNFRKEDIANITDKSGEFVDVLQCSAGPEPRGHQFAGAFLYKVSGLTNHQLTSEKPLKYSHFDKGDTYGKLPGPTTGSTVVALAMHLLQ